MRKNVQRYLVAGIAIVFLFTMFIAHGGGFSFWFEFWWMFPVAFVIAIVVNTVGISGAALFVPFFIIIFPLFAQSLTPLQSVKLGLIIESFGLSSSALAFYAFGFIDKKIGFFAVLGAIPIVVLGALLSSYLPQTILFVMIAGLLVSATALLNMEQKLQKSSNTEAMESSRSSVASGEKVQIETVDGKRYVYTRTKSGYQKRFFGYGIGGFFQGAAGFGIGELGIVSMMMTGVPTRVAIGTSHLVVAVTAITASLIHVHLSSTGQAPVPWNILFMTVPAVVIGGQLAPHVAAKLSTNFLRKFISAIFLIAAALLIVLTITQ